jgi:hypothetical protein
MKTAISFWVTNICKRNVSLADLNLTIKAFTSVNLLDKKHYSYTLEQLNKSYESGSLLAKSSMIKKREIPPVIEDAKKILYQQDVVIPDRARSVLVIKNEKYEELSVFDDSFQEEDPEPSKTSTLTNNTSSSGEKGKP